MADTDASRASAASTVTNDLAQDEEHETQERDLFFRLPRAVRDIVYRKALAKCPGIVRRLGPPAWTGTNRQIRDETMPIFYGENTFEIDFHDNLLRLFKHPETVAKSDANVPALSNLRHINSLTFQYSEPYDDLSAEYTLGFSMSSNLDHPGLLELFDGFDEISRVGDESLDWTDEKVVAKAIHLTKDNAGNSLGASKEFEQVEECVPFQKMTQFLCMFAMACPRAMRFVFVFWWWNESN